MTYTPDISGTIFSVVGPAALWGIGAAFGLGLAVSGIKMFFARMLDKELKLWPKAWVHAIFMAVGISLALVSIPQLTSHMGKALSGQISTPASADEATASEE